MKKKILLVYTSYSSFVKTDFEILSSEHSVEKYHYKPSKGLAKTAFQLFRQFIFLLFNINRFDIIFIWFADYHSLLPILFSRILGKKSFVIIGGYDVAKIPEVKYGALTKPYRSFFARKSFRYATLCLPVAHALKRRINLIDKKAKVKVIHTGHDHIEFGYNPEKRSKTIFTLSSSINRQRIYIKGIDRFIELATMLPEYQFFLVGVHENAKSLLPTIPKNLVLKPAVGFKELISLFQKSSFYAQFSRSEGFPSAICEAMLCGCIPLGTNVGDVKSLIGENGLTIDEWETKSIIDFIHKNQENTDIRKMAHEKIKTNYKINDRAEEIRKLLY